VTEVLCYNTDELRILTAEEDASTDSDGTIDPEVTILG